MTRITGHRFRLGALALFAAAALTGGTVAAASAATTGGSPQPSSYGNHHKQVRHCEFDWLSGITVDHDSQGQDLGYGQQTPYGQPTEHQAKAEKVEAFQLVKVCETGEHLTVTDVGQPYVEETEQRQVEPTPYVSPNPDESPSVYTTPAASPSS
jgi:hypothetical protein